MYESIIEQYLVEILGIQNPTEQQLDQVSIMRLEKCKALVVGLAQFMDFGKMQLDDTSLETLKDCLVALQSRQLIDVVVFDEMNSQMISQDVRNFEPTFLLVDNYYIVFQNLFEMYVDAYNADAHLRQNPALCGDGTVSSSGNRSGMAKSWQSKYSDPNHMRGVCTKHGKVDKILSNKEYNALKPIGLEDGEDSFVTYRSQRHPKLPKGLKHLQKSLAEQSLKQNPRNVNVEIELPNSNLSVVGAGHDVNGNAVVRFQFPNQRAFSVQVYGDMFNDAYSELIRTRQLSSHNLQILEREIIDYIREFGSKQQQSSLRVY